MIRNRIPSVCLYFCSKEWNSELFSLQRNGSERNSESCFYLCPTVHNSEHFSPLRNGSERNSESFLFCGIAGIPPEQTNCSVYSIFRGIIFCQKFPTIWGSWGRRRYLTEDRYIELKMPPASIGDMGQIWCAFKFQIKFRGFKFLFCAPLLMAQGASLRH
jgi:hypothetical protein